MIIIWRVTQNCSLACPFCAFDGTLNWIRREADPAMIRRFSTVLSRYQQQSGRRVLISWMGGEPLSWPPLLDLTRHLHDQLGLSIAVTTNGIPLGSTVIREHLRQHFHELTLSVDGIGSVHDTLRNFPGGFDLLKTSIKSLAAGKTMKKEPPFLRINTLLTRQTFTAFEALCLELAEWGIQEITFNQLGGNDRPEYYRDHRLTPDQADRLSEIVPLLRRRLAKKRVRLAGAENYLQRIRSSSLNERIPIDDCHPGEELLFIDESGMAAPCSFTTREYGVPIDSLDSVAALSDLQHRFRQSRRLFPASHCQDCHSTHVFNKFTKG